MRTLVDEQRVSMDWQAYDNKETDYADVAVF